MRFSPLNIPGPVLIEPTVFGDERGFFLESWNARRFAEAGLDWTFVQDNHSLSSKGVLRGIHFQNPNPQGKLVRVVSGAVWDVVVDLRRSAASFGQWFGVELSADNKAMLWVPPGFGHGFLSLEDGTQFLYKCTADYDPSSEQTLKWNDPDVAIAWPIEGLDVQLSEKDRNGKLLHSIKAYA
ncbi:dTDP-4-dehydrorhamnose 3,5-epimerase [Blastomonas sp. RAC04]|uniref:dTDP-4-dehydrorhamnose 3,5-epimerase n=1 Tax=Blastomonas sp. RAC04 TaxID=1842535 RepID=UPI00083E034D|nr:dTDP-4-dehydrorhamnose 3,5-epimerase [Blastomonas sp. RAC04]AOG00995.1 dTDP-4-dehydrorhamnose 3,5-epimerase [Blastomonas sp. RAC04]